MGAWWNSMTNVMVIKKSSQYRFIRNLSENYKFGTKYNTTQYRSCTPNKSSQIISEPQTNIKKKWLTKNYVTMHKCFSASVTANWNSLIKVPSSNYMLLRKSKSTNWISKPFKGCSRIEIWNKFLNFNSFDVFNHIHKISLSATRKKKEIIPIKGTTERILKC